MIDDFIQLLVDLLLWIPRKMYEFVADSLDWFLSLMPDTGLNAQGAISSWSGDIVYFLTIFEIDYAITVLFTALTARFILRRIPFIG